MATRADYATRFKSEYRDGELPDLIVEVARVADPSAPTQVSTRSWDRHRTAAGHPNAPSARQIVARINKAGRHVLSWPRIVEMSFGTAAQRRQMFVVSARRPEQHHLNIGHLELALRRVARHLAAETVYREQYEPACTEILSQLPAHARATVGALLPTLGQIERIARNERDAVAVATNVSAWDFALERAGLRPSHAVEDTSRGRKTALEPIEMIRVFARLAGELPTFSQAKGFAVKYSLALREVSTDEWDDALAVYRAEMAASGEPLPPGPTPRRRRFDITVEDGALDGLPRRYGRGQWQENPALALDKLEEYLDALPDGQEPRTAHYKAVKARDARADWPALRVFGDYHGGFEAAVAEVRRRQRRRRS